MLGEDIAVQSTIVAGPAQNMAPPADEAKPMEVEEEQHVDDGEDSAPEEASDD